MVAGPRSGPLAGFGLSQVPEKSGLPSAVRGIAAEADEARWAARGTKGSAAARMTVTDAIEATNLVFMIEFLCFRSTFYVFRFPFCVFRFAFRAKRGYRGG